MSQYGDAVGLQGLITAIVNPCQDIEYELNDLNVQRQLSQAFGVQLDLIGTIVGLTRPPGASDDTYRNDLYAQIKINVSQGQPEQAIQTYQLFTAASLVILTEFFPAEVMIESDYLPPDQQAVDGLLKILTDVLPAGVRAMGIVAFDSMNAFAYAGSLIGQGYGTTADPLAGGMYPIGSSRLMLLPPWRLLHSTPFEAVNNAGTSCTGNVATRAVALTAQQAASQKTMQG